MTALTSIIEANPGKSSEEILVIANTPEYTSIPTPALAGLVVGRLPEIQQWADGLEGEPLPGVPAAYIQFNVRRLLQGFPVLPTVDVADVPLVHAVSFIVPDSVLPAYVRQQIAGLGIVRPGLNITLADVEFALQAYNLRVWAHDWFQQVRVSIEQGVTDGILPSKQSLKDSLMV